MDSIHDLGGRQGFGPIIREEAEPAFHERWEARVFVIVAAAGAARAMRNTDQFRHAIERIDPVGYLSHGYYGRWLGGAETLLREAGVIDEDELRARIARLGGDPNVAGAARCASAPDVVGYGPAAPGNRRPLDTPPRFAPGEAVRTVCWTTAGHTRLPAYARGRRGVVAARHDGWVFPDTNAHGRGENPQHLYTVVFSGDELWGPEAEPGIEVSLDLFEPYLETLT
jgi:nitrile hydratase subunit beta